MSTESRVVIADDHPIFRRGLAMVLEADQKLSVVAEAQDGESALAAIREHRPDVVVLDIDMPSPDGLAIARIIRDEGLAVEPVVLTMHDDPALFNAALDAGVRGFVVKDGVANEIVGCIKAVAAGTSYVSPSLTGHLLGRRDRDARRASEASPMDSLTPSEKRVLRLIADSKTSKEIAAELFISVRTVEHHRSNICAKLELTEPNALIRFALTNREKI